MSSPEFIRCQRRGVRGWLHMPTGRFMALMAGAEDPPTPAPTPTPTPTPSPPPADPPAPADPPKPEPTPTPPAKDDDLGPGGTAALAAERKARKEFEKKAKDAQAKLDAIEAEKLTDAQKLQKKADDGERLATAATEKLRKANLIAALADKGLAGAKAKAAARLLDGVEYDDSDEPKNLDDVIKAAKAEYGDDMFKAAKPAAPKINGGGGGGGDDDAPTLTAEELRMAKAFGMTAKEYAAHKHVNVPAPPPKDKETTK